MSTQKSRQDDDHSLKTLRELLTTGSNRSCFDCGQRGPTYVNMTVGSFVCTSCSGKLRGLTPPHRIKSISMATFTSEEMDFIRSRGNDFCRKVWLGRRESPVHGQSNSGEESEATIDLIQKYEKKQWYVDPTEDMYEEAKRSNSSFPVKKTEAILMSQACQITTSRSIPNISTQSIQRPTPGNVRSLPGISPHINPTISSLPQSPVKFSPQTPKSTTVPPVWGAQDSSFAFQTGTANFADFSSFDSLNQSRPSGFFAGFSSASQPFSPPLSSARESYPSSGISYKPPMPLDRYAALAELDFTRGAVSTPDFFNYSTTVSERVPSDNSTWTTGDQYLSSIYQQYVTPSDQLGVQSHHVQPAMTTNPFMNAAATGAGFTFSPPSTALSSPFVPMNAGPFSSSHPASIHSPYFGASPQSAGAAWSSNSSAFSFGSQHLPAATATAAAAAAASNPFLNMPKQNATNPFL